MKPITEDLVWPSLMAPGSRNPLSFETFLQRKTVKIPSTKQKPKVFRWSISFLSWIYSFALQKIIVIQVLQFYHVWLMKDNLLRAESATNGLLRVTTMWVAWHSAILVLANADYLKGVWNKKFDPKKTKDTGILPHQWIVNTITSKTLPQQIQSPQTPLPLTKEGQDKWQFSMYFLPNERWIAESNRLFHLWFWVLGQPCPLHEV